MKVKIENTTIVHHVKPYDDGTVLVGFVNGMVEYDRLLKDNLKIVYGKNVKHIIKFPENIEAISISYIEGLLEGLTHEYYKGELMESISFEGNYKVVNKVEKVFYNIM